ncbi:MAG TPA: multidrug efflux SMR transporter [Spirochaetota bacterium]|nr:multidrug efflux SMR transporter [Spirochaetota bacterium]HPJ38493.1 multidrug efflux SMR transporter [Spirochaetota bacterium]HPQ53495.1 multidrug efflux SMR transporter [Spirochaetota bacterium]
MRWFLLLLGIITELCGSTCMKLSNGFTNVYASVLTFVFWCISFSVFIFALKHFDLSFAYAVWAGLGILLVSIIGIAFFREPVTLLKILSIFVIIIGVVLLNICELLDNQ